MAERPRTPSSVSPTPSEPSALRSHGGSAPLGATVAEGGVNFSLYSRDADRLELLFFDQADDPKPSQIVELDPVDHRTYHYWHVFVPGIRPGQLYGFRAHGPFDPARGMRFDPTKVLLDPYGRGVVVPKGYSRIAAGQAGGNVATAMKSVVGGGCASQASFRADDHLRDARARIHSPPEFRDRR